MKTEVLKIRVPLRFFSIHVLEGPKCLCSLCGLAIGAARDDPRWMRHAPDCGGCEVCEIAVRLWKSRSPEEIIHRAAVMEARLHIGCLQAATEDQKGRAA